MIIQRGYRQGGDKGSLSETSLSLAQMNALKMKKKKKGGTYSVNFCLLQSTGVCHLPASVLNQLVS